MYSSPSFSSGSHDPLLDGKRKALFKRCAHPMLIRMVDNKAFLIEKESDKSMKSINAHTSNIEIELLE